MANNNFSVHNVLCPADFSASGMGAFSESVRLARWFGAEITVVHVIPFAMPLPGEMGYVPVPVKGACRAALMRLQQFVDATDHSGVPVSLVCREGHAADEIRAVARERNAELVVMGTHGRSGLKRLVLGSVTEAVLNHPPAPVLTVNRNRSRRDGPFQTVLCATDVSEWSAGTIAAALAIAGEGAKRFILLNVIEGGAGSTGGARERTALTAVHESIPIASQGSLPIEERVACGEPDREILAVAAEESVDLIILGAHGRGAVGHVFGSTAQSIVREAPCPVMVIPAGYVWPATGIVRRGMTERAGSNLTA
jgi:nucleotide-binding universal stress UspA family protein